LRTLTALTLDTALKYRGVRHAIWQRTTPSAAIIDPREAHCATLLTLVYTSGHISLHLCLERAWLWDHGAIGLASTPGARLRAGRAEGGRAEGGQAAFRRPHRDRAPNAAAPGTRQFTGRSPQQVTTAAAHLRRGVTVATEGLGRAGEVEPCRHRQARVAWARARALYVPWAWYTPRAGSNRHRHPGILLPRRWPAALDYSG